MKHTRKILSLLLALIMMLSLAVTAMATDPETPSGNTETKYSVTITKSTEDHTYVAYQIFKGDLFIKTVDNKEKPGLLNLTWGDDVLEANKAALLAFGGTNYQTAQDLAAAITESNVKAFAQLAFTCVDTNSPTGTSLWNDTDKTHVISNLPVGYYLILDKTPTQEPDDFDYTAFIMEVVQDSSLKHKGSVPTVEKKVTDTNDTTGETQTGWDSADYDIGDDVPFVLTATLGDDLNAYENYLITFHDTMSKGLVLNATYAKDEDDQDPATVTSGVTVKVDDVDKTDKFTITAETNDSGITALTIICNDVTAEDVGAEENSVITVNYTAKLTTDANVGSAGNHNTVYLDYSNNPNWTGTGTTPTGKTPEDTVIVFTYEVDVNKIDPDENALPGAEFTLYKKISGDRENGDTTSEVIKNADGNVIAHWKQVGKMILKDKSTHEFMWKGIDDGTYKLVETKTPDGYNTINPIEFTVTASHDEKNATPVLITMTVDNTNIFTADKNTGILSAKVENRPGAVLPETGGMGTTILYIAGGILVLAAIVLLVTKKRMTSAE